MKILHLSDLHIGKNVNGFSMLDEQKHIFRQIIGHIRAEGPDAVIIAGDIYDRTNPGGEAIHVFDDFLTELSQEDAAVMIISGNHDSPEKINYASRLLTDKRIYFYGAFDDSMRRVALRDDYGEAVFWLLPFIRPAAVRGIFENIELDSYDDVVSAALETANIDYSSRNVLISHQFYTKAGIIPVRSESELNPVGGLDAVDAGLLEKFDYIALGHLHGAQRVGSEHIRYCGSPLKYSFSEWHQEKSATLAEIGGKGEITLKALPLVPIHDMREIKGELDMLMSEGISSLADNEDYLRVILTDEEEIIDPMGKLRSVYPNIMSLDFENSRTSVDLAAVTTDAQDVERLSAYELFGEFFLDMQGSVMSEEQSEIVRDLLETERTGEE